MNRPDGEEVAWRRLGALRRKIDRIDDCILSLLSRRLAAAEEIGKLKKAHRLPVADPARERQVMKRVISRMEPGPEPETVQEIFSGIIAACRAVQEPFMADKLPPREEGLLIPDDERIAVIGGTGRMGSWMADLLEGRGHRVLKTGRSTDILPEDAAETCRVVIVSVPVKDTLEVIRRVAPLVREDGLLMDLTSVKKAPLEEMLACSRSQVVGLHPLFGPESYSNNGPLTVAVCPGRGRSGVRWITEVLRHEGYCIDIIDPGEHDRIMGIVQGVNHFATLALALCISESDIPVETLERWSTPSFRAVLHRIRGLFAQPYELFQALMTETQASRTAVDQYRLTVNKLWDATTCEDRDRFRSLFRRLSEIIGSCDNRACQLDLEIAPVNEDGQERKP